MISRPFLMPSRVSLERTVWDRSVARVLRAPLSLAIRLSVTKVLLRSLNFLALHTSHRFFPQVRLNLHDLHNRHRFLLLWIRLNLLISQCHHKVLLFPATHRWSNLQKSNILPIVRVRLWKKKTSVRTQFARLVSWKSKMKNFWRSSSEFKRKRLGLKLKRLELKPKRPKLTKRTTAWRKPFKMKLQLPGNGAAIASPTMLIVLQNFAAEASFTAAHCANIETGIVTNLHVLILALSLVSAFLVSLCNLSHLTISFFTPLLEPLEEWASIHFVSAGFTFSA